MGFRGLGVSGGSGSDSVEAHSVSLLRRYVRNAFFSLAGVVHDVQVRGLHRMPPGGLKLDTAETAKKTPNPLHETPGYLDPCYMFPHKLP